MSSPRVTFFLGSASDAPVAQKGTKILDKLGVPWTIHVASAHRTPEHLAKLIDETPAEVLVGVAGLSAALPGVLAAHTVRPVVGVPVSGKTPFDSLLSVAQMPPGIPVASVGVDRGDNAALMAAAILAVADGKVRDALESFRAEQREKVLESSRVLRGEMGLDGV